MVDETAVDFGLSILNFQVAFSILKIEKLEIISFFSVC